jgi:mannitol-1-/sugar-/sorbitol-6-phosphatase
MPEIICEAVLFDMDGTILDSSIPVQRQWRLWAGSVGIPFDKVLEVMHGRRAIETMQIVAPHLPQPQTVNDFLEVEAKDTEGIVEIPGARAMLEALPRDRWAVVTSATYDMARSRMRAAGLPEVDILISADRVTHGKPHPEGFLAAAAALNIAPEKCLVVEDSPAGIQAGLSAGMQVLGVTSHYGGEELGAALCVGNFAGDFRMTQNGSSILLRF